MCLKKDIRCIVALSVLIVLVLTMIPAIYVWADERNDLSESFTISGEHVELGVSEKGQSDISVFSLAQNKVTVIYKERVNTFLRPDSDVIGNGSAANVNPACAIKYIYEDGSNEDSRGTNGSLRYRYVYCTDFKKDSPTGQQLTQNGYLNRYVHFVLYYGAMYYGETCRNASFSTGNWRYDYLITQMAIHVVNGEFTLDNLVKGIRASNASESDENLVISKITAMVDGAYSAGDAPHKGWDSDGWFRTDDAKYTSFSLSKETDTWTKGENGSYYSGWITPILTTIGNIYANSDISSFENSVTEGVSIEKKYPGTSYSPYRLVVPSEKFSEWQKTGKTITSNVTVSIPSHWKVSQFSPSGGEKFQSVCFITPIDKHASYSGSVSLKVPRITGDIVVNKVSENPKMTNNNPNYSLEGAVYELYRVEADGSFTHQEGKYATDENGRFVIKDLMPGIYKLREISAPKGFMLSADYSEEITVSTEQTTNVTVSDVPKYDSFPIRIQKRDSQTGLNEGQGEGTLSGAEFTVKFYTNVMSGDYSFSEEIPEKIWIVKTDTDGCSKLSDKHFVAGDEFYRNQDGEVICPYGTLTVQESKPPAGYKPDGKIYVINIFEDESGEVKHTNLPEINEQVTEIKVIKMQEGTTYRIPGVEFELEYPDAVKRYGKTDKNGELFFKGLSQGNYILREHSTTDNYMLSKDEVTFSVDKNNNIVNGTIISSKDDKSSEIIFEYDSNNNGVITFGNKTKNYSIFINKVSDKSIALDGAEFTLYGDRELQTVVASGVSVNGHVKLNDLKANTRYYLLETKIPEGYYGEMDIAGNPLVYEIYAEVSPDKGYVFYVNGEKITEKDTDSSKDIYVSQMPGNKVLNLKVVNTMGSRLPETGSGLMIPIVFAGITFMAVALLTKERKKRDN